MRVRDREGWSGAMTVLVLRWVAVPLAIAGGCAGGVLFFTYVAAPAVIDSAFRCMFGCEPQTTWAKFVEDLEAFILMFGGGWLAGFVSVILAALAAPRFKNRVKAIALVVPLACALPLSDWELRRSGWDLNEWFFLFSIVTGGLVAWWLHVRWSEKCKVKARSQFESR